MFSISPPGDGKSLLDQHFGHLKGRRDKNLDRGEEGKNKADNAYQTATPIFDTGNGIRQTKAWVVTFDRKQTHRGFEHVNTFVGSYLCLRRIICKNNSTTSNGINVQCCRMSTTNHTFALKTWF